MGQANSGLACSFEHHHAEGSASRAGVRFAVRSCISCDPLSQPPHESPPSRLNQEAHTQDAAERAHRWLCDRKKAVPDVRVQRTPQPRVDGYDRRARMFLGGYAREFRTGDAMRPWPQTLARAICRSRPPWYVSPLPAGPAPSGCVPCGRGGRPGRSESQWANPWGSEHALPTDVFR